ncbi:MAG: hypothetical protein MJE63_06275 [Proteobacteria bacterium]|nr:hypothetical protein [Pseudomonadota bacterium]
MTREYKTIIDKYIRAKDTNKPYLLADVFTKSAKLDMVLDTTAISFPSKVEGEANISRTLVSDFNKTYENIYTICFDDSVKQENNTLICKWLVGMSEKENGSVRVGCGQYKWHFTKSNIPRVQTLSIVVGEMVSLSSYYRTDVLFWLDNLSSVWINSQEALQSMPTIEDLKSIRQIVT